MDEVLLPVLKKMHSREVMEGVGLPWVGLLWGEVWRKQRNRWGSGCLCYTTDMHGNNQHFAHFDLQMSQFLTKCHTFSAMSLSVLGLYRTSNLRTCTCN